jgi:hypothetical protein
MGDWSTVGSIGEIYRVLKCFYVRNRKARSKFEILLSCNRFLQWKLGPVASNGCCACAPSLVPSSLVRVSFSFAFPVHVSSLSISLARWPFSVTAALDCARNFLFPVDRSGSLSYFLPFFSPDRDTHLPSSFALCPVCLRFAALSPPP